MNMKNLVVLVALAWSFNGHTQANLPGAQNGQGGDQQGNGQQQQSYGVLCSNALDEYERSKAAAAGATPPQAVPEKSTRVKECEHYNLFSNMNGKGNIKAVPTKNTRTMDGAVTCTESESFHMDFTACGKAVALYNAVMVAEVAMEEQQKIRTDLKNKSIQRKANEDAAKGDLQSGMFDAAGASNDHMKNMETEKAVAYVAAIGALTRAIHIIPNAEDILKKCEQVQGELKASCPEFVKTNGENLLANSAAIEALKAGRIRFMAKAAAAGAKAWMYGQAVEDIDKAKGSIIADEEAPDLMVDRCQFNPTDPACAKSSGQRVKGASLTSGQFGVDGMGNNAFDLTPGSDATFEEGAPTDLTTSDPIAGINSPFVEDAKDAKDILNPAAAASFQPTGGAGGGGGGVGGGGGGGGASLGSDLAGADKDGDKEAQIKTGKVSGAYAQGGGGGYKGIGKSGKDDANPFASLFDAKSNGGVEEDRSIASGDIDGKASGLFQKISKRYGQIQADKRVEAKNLE